MIWKVEFSLGPTDVEVLILWNPNLAPLKAKIAIEFLTSKSFSLWLWKVISHVQNLINILAP